MAELDADAWSAFFLPKGTPASIIQRLQRAAVATMETPSVQERLREIGVTVVAPERRSSEYLAKFVVSEIAKWANVIKTAGITAE